MRKKGTVRSSTYDAAEVEQGFWPSYADMMSAVALILFFLMLLSYIQNLITGNDLQSTQQALSSTRLELSDTKDELSLTLNEVEDAQKKLATIQLTLDKAQEQLLSAQEEIDAQKDTISLQTSQIAEQTDKISAQQVYLDATNEELVRMRSQMQSIAVLRLSILEQIRDSIVKVMGDSSKVAIGENGSIILSEGVLFDVGSSAIKRTSQTVLNQMIQVFRQFLSEGDNAKYVDSIVISGHTDSTGDDAANRKLSTDRANAVLDYLLTGNRNALEKYSEYFCAAGYGETRPVDSNDTEEGKAANRRIEISIILKDESVLKIVEEYLKVELPEGAESKAAKQP